MLCDQRGIFAPDQAVGPTAGAPPYPKRKRLTQSRERVALQRPGGSRPIHGTVAAPEAPAGLRAAGGGAQEGARADSHVQDARRVGEFSYESRKSRVHRKAASLS